MAENMGMPPLEEPKKNNRTLIIVIAVVVVLCCCCIIVLTTGYYLGDCITSPNDPALCPLASTLLSTI